MIFSKIPKDKLVESITIVNDLARPSDDNFYEEMAQQYGRVRKFLSSLLQNIELRAAPGGKAVINAFDYLKSLGPDSKQFLNEAPLGIVGPSWKRFVFDKEQRVTKRGYVLCFIVKLQDALRRRDVYVENSQRWGDPRAKLLQGADWQANRIQVCRSLGHPTNSQEAISSLVFQLDKTYGQVANNFKDNDRVKLDLSNKHPSLTITNLDKLEEQESLTLLSKKVGGLLPQVDMAELFLSKTNEVVRYKKQISCPSSHLFCIHKNLLN